MSTHFQTLIFTAGVVLGISIGYGTSFATEIAIAVGLLIMGQMIVCVVERKHKASGFVFSFATLVLAFGLLLGIVRVQLASEKIPYICDGSCSFDAKVISSPESKDAYQILAVHPTESADETLDVQLRLPLYPRYEIGETVRVSGKVAIPSIVPPHGDKKSFDYGAYLATRNIGSEMLFPKIEVMDTDAHSVTEYLGRWKEDLMTRENKFVASPVSTLATGMLFGNSSMSKDLTQTFRVAGLSHIIVLSGFNIAIVIASILFLFAFVPLVLRIALASTFVILFVMMVGAEASVMRATAMAFIGLLATLIGRAYVAKQALLISFLVIIFYSPESLLHDVSLHLSFLATAGIVYMNGPIQEIVRRYSSRKSFVELSSTTLSAYFATLPYVCYTFGTVSPYALLSNSIVLPFVPIAMLLSFLVVCFSYLSDALAMMAGYADTLSLNFIFFIAHVVELLPFSYLTLSISFTTMCLLYGIFSVIILFLHNNKKDETLATTESEYLTGVISY